MKKIFENEGHAIQFLSFLGFTSSDDGYVSRNRRMIAKVTNRRAGEMAWSRVDYEIVK